MFRGEISAYGSFIDDYIYLAPELREDGTIRTDVLIQGSFLDFPTIQSTPSSTVPRRTPCSRRRL